MKWKEVSLKGTETANCYRLEQIQEKVRRRKELLNAGKEPYLTAFSENDEPVYWKLAFKGNTTDVLIKRSERRKSTIAIMMGFYAVIL